MRYERKHLFKLLVYFQQAAIIKIQAWVRANVAQNDYRKLSRSFVHVCPLVRASVCLSVRLSVRLSVCPSVCLSVCSSVCLSVCPSACLSVHFYTSYFSCVVSMQDPPVKTVRKFLHLLQHSDVDFEEELGES